MLVAVAVGGTGVAVGGTGVALGGTAVADGAGGGVGGVGGMAGWNGSPASKGISGRFGPGPGGQGDLPLGPHWAYDGVALEISNQNAIIQMPAVANTNDSRRIIVLQMSTVGSNPLESQLSNFAHCGPDLTS